MLLKNAALLENTGLRLKIRSSSKGSAKPTVVGAPGNLSIKDGADSGVVLLSWSKDAAAINYEIQFCEGEPAGEESWSLLGYQTHCRNNEFKGFEPAKKGNFRVRCHGEAGPGPWSTISLIIR